MRSIRALSASAIFDGQVVLKDKALLIEDGIILAIVNRNEVASNLLCEEYPNCVISPGLLDLQLNGCGGVLFNDEISHTTLETMHQTNLQFGTTGFLPTLITCDFAEVRKALAVVKAWFTQYGNCRGVLGLHLEGPFISLEKRGIHPAKYIVPPTLDLLQEIAGYAKFYPLKLTIAPEQFTVAQIDYLVQAGVIVALGHSNASYQQAVAAFQHGALSVTHMFNAMSGMTGRNPGLIAATLAHTSYLGVIADLLHVDPANLQLLAKLKPDTTYLVTDAVTPSGTSLTEFNFAGKHLWVRDGLCVDENGTLGGAYLTMNVAVQNCVVHCGLSLAQALKMATSIPARLLGIEAQVGRLAIGCRANLIALNLATYVCTIL